MMPTTSHDACSVETRQLKRFAAGKLRGVERRQILEHLLSGCRRCREYLQAWREMGSSDADADNPYQDEAPSMARILASLGERAARIERERSEARHHLEAFLGHPVPRQWTVVRNSRKLDSWSFCAFLLDAAFVAIYDDPRRCRELSAMALEIAERLDVEPYGERSVLDLRGRAWARLGNAQRALGELSTARESLARARELINEGTGDPLEEAELHYFEASMLRAQRRLEEALRKVRRSIRIYREIGETHLEGRSLLNEASILVLRGDAVTAEARVLEAITKIDVERDPHLALAARHNLVWELMEQDRVEEAEEKLGEFAAEYHRVGDRSSVARLSWLEARLRHKQGLAEQARSAYRRALDGFGALELPYEVANTTLDLVALEIETGCFAEVRALAADTLVLFRSLGVAREALAAWLILQQAAEAEAVTLALVERLGRYFSEARFRPELTFDAVS